MGLFKSSIVFDNETVSKLINLLIQGIYIDGELYQCNKNGTGSFEIGEQIVIKICDSIVDNIQNGGIFVTLNLDYLFSKYIKYIGGLNNYDIGRASYNNSTIRKISKVGYIFNQISQSFSGYSGDLNFMTGFLLFIISDNLEKNNNIKIWGASLIMYDDVIVRKDFGEEIGKK